MISTSARQFIAPVLVFASVAAIVLWRTSHEPMQPYGADAAHYIEHTARLDVLQTLRELQLGPGGSDTIGSMTEDLDGSFPPLLHLVTVLVGAVTGHEAHSVLWTGLLWLLLLAGSIALIVQRLSASRAAAAAAFCGTLLLPALHASASRYYYDLPMTALLWLSIAVALGTWGRRPIVAGLVVGGLLFAADITKWTALPFGLIMLAGAAATGRTGADAARVPWAARLKATAIAVTLSSLLVLGFLELAGNHDSFTAMLGDIGERGEIWGPQGVDSDRTAAIASHIFRDLQPLSQERLSFYGVRMVTSVFSPILLAIGLLLSASWALRSRRGWPLVVVTVLGQSAFLLLRIPPTDDRFLLTMAPALVIAAALGWQELPERMRRVVASLTLTVGLAVAVDFHSAAPGSIEPAARAVGQEGFSELLRWGLHDSADQRGWARRDRQRANHEEARERLWTHLDGCAADVFKVASERSLVSDRSSRGDLYWLRYRSLLSQLEQGGRKRRVLLSCDEANSDEVEIALAALRPGSQPRRPRCIRASDWQLEGLATPSDDGNSVAIWSRLGKRLCSTLK